MGNTDMNKIELLRTIQGILSMDTYNDDMKIYFIVQELGAMGYVIETTKTMGIEH